MMYIWNEKFSVPKSKVEKIMYKSNVGTLVAIWQWCQNTKFLCVSRTARISVILSYNIFPFKI